MGDNPDASKALRLLTKDLKLVERKGDGGRQDPYLYTVHKEVFLEPLILTPHPQRLAVAKLRTHEAASGVKYLK